MTISVPTKVVPFWIENTKQRVKLLTWYSIYCSEWSEDSDSTNGGEI